MNKADRYMYELLNRILTEGYKDVNPRPKYADGTPAHSISVNGNFRTYDIGAGEFPITSLRPIAWKTGIRETLAIYQNQSNQIDEFERMGCGWWKDWALEDNTIGRAYPYNLESHRPNEMKRLVVRVPRRIVDQRYGMLEELPKFEMLPPINNNVYFDRYVVIGRDYDKPQQMADDKHAYYKIQFLSNGYVTTLRADDIGRYQGTALNPYERTVYGVGYLGDYKSIANIQEWELKILKKKWAGMLKRCYSDKYRADAPTYKDMFVHHRWHCFANFLKDVRYLPQYFLAREEKFKDWQLDKDYYGSNAYSKETCVFLKLKENVTYARNDGYYQITDQIGNVSYDLTIAGFAERAGLNLKRLRRALSSGDTYNGFIIEKKKESDDCVYRYELSRNQVVELLKGLIENPYGRRHIISFWHWANIDKKALVECAYETIWNVRNDGNGNEFLDMTLIQRSGDSITASCSGVNECQYAALLMMVAKHCGYIPGKMAHFIANEQIYDRHVDQAKEMIRRYEEALLTDVDGGGKEQPRLIFNPKRDNFYEFTTDDFELLNYEPMRPQLVLPLGI